MVPAPQPLPFIEARPPSAAFVPHTIDAAGPRHAEPSLASLLDDEIDRPTNPRARPLSSASAGPASSPSLPPSLSPRSAGPSPERAMPSRPSSSPPLIAMDLPPTTPPPRRVFASAPVEPHKPSRAPSRRQPPLAMAARRSLPLVPLLLVTLTVVGLTALWQLRPGSPVPAPPPVTVAAVTPSPSPTPSPEAPAAKVEHAEVEELLGDVWIHPLQGPARRMPIRDSRLFGAERVGDRPSECRGGHCGIDLGGTYGEPVYAVHEGVIDRVQRAANTDHGGHYVRIAHRDGSIFSQYFHLSAIPSRFEQGVHVKAGELIGWVGLSGVKHSQPHLHFTISVQDPDTSNDRYLDPEPLVALWPLRVPSRSDERMRVSTTTAAGLARGFIRRRHHRAHVVAQALPPPPADSDADSD